MTSPPEQVQPPVDPPGAGCQLERFPGVLERGAPGRDEPWSWYVRRRGRNALRRLGRLLRPEVAAASGAGACPFPAAQLRTGDLVRVRPAEEIRRTLDARGGVKGCSFGTGMYQYCGRELRVARTVHRFFDEARFRMLRARDMVILEGIHCDGSDLADTRGCDRMCAYFWRTEWLERVEEAGR